MKQIDNLNEKLGDDLRATLQPGSKVSIAAATFSIFAFEALRAELESVDELRFLFTAPSFASDASLAGLSKQRREFFVPSSRRGQESVVASDLEIRLRNKLTQRAIARECAAWIRKKAVFRANASGRPMLGSIAIDDDFYYPVQGFTTADLGFEPGESLMPISTKFEGVDESRQFLESFNAVWRDPEALEDVTAAVTEHIESAYRENSPERIYFLILAHLFSEFLDEVSEDVLPNERTGFLDTQIWQSLYAFQRDAARGAINKLESFNGCILADSVGLGKTFTALAVIKYYELRNKSVLVLAPKKLADNWTNYNKNLVTNEFASDRFNYDVLAHTDLSRTRGESMGIPLDRVNWGNYDLVVIDESHNFRNAVTSGEGESRYERLMRMVMRAGVQTKVLMLSATPVNNDFNDLKHQLALAYEGDATSFARRLDLSTSVEQVFRDAQAVFNEWSRLQSSERTADALLGKLDFEFFELLDAVTIARSRKHITSFYDTAEIGTFPERLRPIAIRPPLTDVPSVPSFDALYEQLAGLTLAVYTPLQYVLASRASRYAEEYGVVPKGMQAAEDQSELAARWVAGRQQGIHRLMTVNLLKRLESSVQAFRMTLERLADTVEATIDAVQHGRATIDDLGAPLAGAEADDDELEAGAAIGDKVRIRLDDLDSESFLRDLTSDRDIVRGLLRSLEPVTPDRDVKLRELMRLIDEKRERPINDGNRKVLIFTAFADTAKYLYECIKDAVPRESHAALITGQGNPSTTLGSPLGLQEVLTLFSPRSKKRDLVMPDESREIEILIGTDCISEGQNLQDCDYLINYDIHWNPVRIVQRFGRIDRIGSTNAQVQLVNFWPDISLDEYINLKERVENRMVIADLAGAADDNLLSDEHSDAEYRREQLRKLQDEVIELEDAKAGVSIVDLGLNDFRMDLLESTKRYGDLTTAPRGLHAVVPSDRATGLEPGVIFVLLDRNVQTAGDRGNRLHPHYLVYVRDDGTIRVDHTQVKEVLDMLRAASAGRDEPVPEAYRPFNRATDDGVDMTAYSALLAEAIGSMTSRTDELDIESLFSAGPTSALTQDIGGLDDFELIAFLAIVDPEGASE
ncbi:ATP-dependent helicase [Agrococcus sediminis]|uniref:ATP-dependent helicase n=1 Tax=Agrococcus sediminis TaxID=2599924 RepID=A0A5M8QMZ8_9MICO|nr:helicase-related protein [Agrococcus sediminis]KAA6435963.1 ATP-dependent helicase [Agrococcus sediminis]